MIFRCLLRLFPSSFRRRYADEIVGVVRERVGQTRRREGRVRAARLGAFHAADLLRSAIAERRVVRRASRRARKATPGVERGAAAVVATRSAGAGGFERLAGGLLQDGRYAVRALLNTPAFSGIVALTLALGVGATTAIFTVINGILIKPLPYPDPDSLVAVYHTVPSQGVGRMGHTPATYFTYREHNRAFVDLGAWHPGQLTITGTDLPERVDSLVIDDAVLPLLGAGPVLGRPFSAADVGTEAPLTIILAHDFWERRFGGRADAIGQTLRVNGTAAEIIGVMPAGFRFLDHDAAIFAPLRLDAPVPRGSGASLDQSISFDYQALARLREGVTLAEAAADVARMVPLSAELYAWIDPARLAERRFGGAVVPAKEIVVRDIGSVLWVLFGTVGLVLLIACANVANLFLVRAEGRRRELAVRTAIGASRARLARQFLVESALLGGLGGAGGLWIAAVSVPILVGLAPSALPRVHEVGVDPAVLLFTLGVSLAAGLVFGMIPLVYYGSPDLVPALKEGGRGGGAGSRRQRLRVLLATGEVALALVLLVGSGLMIRSFQGLRGVDPGFQRPEQVLTFRLALPRGDVPEIERAVGVYEQVLDEISRLPDVATAGAISGLAMESRTNQNSFLIEDRPLPPGGEALRGAYKAVAGDYFSTMGIPLVAGRLITWDDIHERRPVGLITENFAREVWGEPSAAVGKRIRHADTDPWREIIGVVGNVRDVGLRRGPPRVAYWPVVVENFVGFPIWLRRDMAFVVRSAQRAPAELIPEVRRVIGSINPNLPMAEVGTLDDLVSRDMARTSFTLVMLGVAAAVALLLGTVGVYGVVAYVFAHRVREIGIRMALGATHADIRSMVLRHGARVAIGGVAIGVLIAVGLTRFLASLLFGVGAVDPTTYVVAAAAVAAVAMLASYLPARRAARVDPLDSLRGD